MSKQWNTRPSELVDIRDPYKAWCFDEAVSEFGTACDAVIQEASEPKKGQKLSKAQRAAKADNALRQMLGLEKKYRKFPSPPRPKE